MQIEKGAIRKYFKAVEKKYLKKAHNRKKRMQSKNINMPNPQYNRYDGGWFL